jgi:paired amphipathic helix protein Sin3a
VTFQRQEQIQNGTVSASPGPMLSFTYRYSEIALEDATSLVIHHMKRQSGIHTDDKRKIKRLLKQFLPSLFFMTPGELSDDDDDGGVPERGKFCRSSSVDMWIA